LAERFGEVGSGLEKREQKKKAGVDPFRAFREPYFLNRGRLLFTLSAVRSFRLQPANRQTG
jgi:hypothetical protein